MRDKGARFVIVAVVAVVAGIQVWSGFPLSMLSAAESREVVKTPASNETLAAVRRTMVSMRTIEKALYAYREDTNTLPGVSEWTDLSALESDLVPWYLTKLPKNDSWGWPLQYRREQASDGYSLRSRGSDGALDPKLDTPLSPLVGGDIIMNDHRFGREGAPLEIERILDDPGRQRQVLLDLRSIGTACEEYAIDNNFYPVFLEESDVAAMADHLLPNYIKTLPSEDPWGHPYRYRSSPSAESYRIVSLGKDGLPGPENLDPGSDDPGRDLVFEQGQFPDSAALEGIAKRQTDETERRTSTVEAMHRIAMECWEYAAANDAFPALSGWTDVSKMKSLLRRPMADFEQERPFRTEDSWGNPLQYRADPEGHGWWLRSRGSDGVPGAPADAGPMDPRRDIIMRNEYLEDDEYFPRIPAVGRSDSAVRARETMTSLAAVVVACRTYALNQHHYPIADHWMDTLDLRLVLGLKYPLFLMGDAWGQPIQYLAGQDGSSYTVRSLGKDGKEDAATGPSDDPDAEIVFSNGAFRSWPRPFPPEKLPALLGIPGTS